MSSKVNYKTHIGYRIVQWIKTSRIQTAMVTSLALWAGYISVDTIAIIDFFALGFVGCLIHVWGFMLNEVKDYKYDKEHSATGQHPLADEKLCPRRAKYVSWASGTAGLVFAFLYFNSVLGYGLLLLSFVAGTAYNYFSKRHWWANIYLSVWVLSIVLSGAAFAGQFNINTWILAGALSIQIFVQVIQGDMKDILGPENTFAEQMGVQCEDKKKPVIYPGRFRKLVIGSKLIELGLLSYLVYSMFLLNGIDDIIVLIAFIVFASVFLSTSTLYLTGFIDRDKIKRRSSVHELSSILMLGVSLYWVNHSLSILIAIVPVVWYLMINKIIHSSAFNPDI